MDLEQEAGAAGADGAEQAFEGLRADVAALRRGIELLYRQAQQAPAPTPAAADYSLTLGKMERTLQAIEGRLAGVERQPALMLTPVGLQTEINAVAYGAAQVLSQPFAETVQAVQAVTQELKALAGRVHARREQRAWLWLAGGCGVLGGVLLWFLLAALLPWGAGDWLASLPIASGGPWAAGEALLQRDSPQSWDRMVRLYRACPQDTAVGLCEAAITVRTIPQGPEPVPETRTAPSAIAPTRPAPSRGRTAPG